MEPLHHWKAEPPGRWATWGWGAGLLRNISARASLSSQVFPEGVSKTGSGRELLVHLVNWLEAAQRISGSRTRSSRTETRELDDRELWRRWEPCFLVGSVFIAARPLKRKTPGNPQRGNQAVSYSQLRNRNWLEASRSVASQLRSWSWQDVGLLDRIWLA